MYGLNALDRIFGLKIFSLHFLSVATCFSAALIYFFLFVSSWMQGYESNFVQETGWRSVVCLFLGVAPVFFISKKMRRLWLVLLAYLIYKEFIAEAFEIIAIGHTSGIPIVSLIPFVMPAGFLGGALLFSLFIYLMRKSLLRVSKAESIITPSIILLANCFPFVMIYVVWKWLILSLGIYSVAENLGVVSTTEKGWGMGVLLIILFSAVCLLVINLLFLLSALVFLMFSLAMLVHRFFWPLLEKPIYILQRHGIAKRHKLKLATGIALLTLSWGRLETLEKFLEKLLPF